MDSVFLFLLVSGVWFLVYGFWFMVSVFLFLALVFLEAVDLSRSAEQEWCWRLLGDGRVGPIPIEKQEGGVSSSQEAGRSPASSRLWG